MKNKKFLYSILLTIFFIYIAFSINNAYAQEIEWIMSYEEAKIEAQNKNFNMFILITAPTWCGPCQWMDANTFTNSNIINLLNDSYVPVKILDTNYEDINKFSFQGYPTVLIYDENSKKLNEIVGGVDANTLLNIINKYPYGEIGNGYYSEDYKEEKYYYKAGEQYGEGIFINLGNGEWVEEKHTQNTEFYYIEENRDYYWIILYDESRKMKIALPISGGLIYWTNEDNNWVWMELFFVKLKS